MTTSTQQLVFEVRPGLKITSLRLKGDPDIYLYHEGYFAKLDDVSHDYPMVLTLNGVTSIPYGYASDYANSTEVSFRTLSNELIGTFVISWESPDGITGQMYIESFTAGALKEDDVLLIGDLTAHIKYSQIIHTHLSELHISGWERLKRLTHQESLTLLENQNGKPVVRFLLYSEFKLVHPTSVVTEAEYGRARIWTFEYVGNQWVPVKWIDPGVKEIDDKLFEGYIDPITGEFTPEREI